MIEAQVLFYLEDIVEELNIGKKIQTLRVVSGLSARKLAMLANITPSMLSQIENDQVNPSINTLRSIAQALNAPLYTFFKDGPSGTPVVHPNERRVIGLKGEPDVRYELLTQDMQGSIEFCLMVIPPHRSSFRDMQSHSGEEVAFMLSGEAVELDMDGTLYRLEMGDSVRIPANTPHVWSNQTDVTVNVIFAITPPTF